MNSILFPKINLLSGNIVHSKAKHLFANLNFLFVRREREIQSEPGSTDPSPFLRQRKGEQYLQNFGLATQLVRGRHDLESHHTGKSFPLSHFDQREAKATRWQTWKTSQAAGVRSLAIARLDKIQKRKVHKAPFKGRWLKRLLLALIRTTDSTTNSEPPGTSFVIQCVFAKFDHTKVCGNHYDICCYHILTYHPSSHASFFHPLGTVPRSCRFYQTDISFFFL